MTEAGSNTGSPGGGAGGLVIAASCQAVSKFFRLFQLPAFPALCHVISGGGKTRKKDMQKWRLARLPGICRG
jgi:hypothetical protein